MFTWSRSSQVDVARLARPVHRFVCQDMRRKIALPQEPKRERCRSSGTLHHAEFFGRSYLSSLRGRRPQGVNLPSVDQHDVLFMRWSNVRPHIEPEAAKRIEEQGASNSD